MACVCQLNWSTAVLTDLHFIYGCFDATMSEPNHYDRDYTAYKAWNI